MDELNSSNTGGLRGLLSRSGAVSLREPVILGRTGLEVGRLGIASSYRAPAAAYEAAFEQGCNYFTWGTFIKGRSKAMGEAIRNITRSGGRERLVLALWSYAHSSFVTRRTFQSGLKALGLDYADILILGYFSNPPSRRIRDGALALREQGLVRHLAVSGHNRKVFPSLAEDDAYGAFHIRYNAVHRGAEEDAFQRLEAPPPGVVSFTGTNWGQLLDPKRMPPGETAPTAADCYQFVLSHPAVSVCMTGPRTREEMSENLRLLDRGPMTEGELARMRRIGDFIYRNGGKG